LGSKLKFCKISRVENVQMSVAEL